MKIELNLEDLECGVIIELGTFIKIGKRDFLVVEFENKFIADDGFCSIVLKLEDFWEIQKRNTEVYLPKSYYSFKELDDIIKEKGFKIMKRHSVKPEDFY